MNAAGNLNASTDRRNRLPSLAAVPEVLLTELDRARRGVVVLAIDGLSYSAAVAAGWDQADLTGLMSTFPSTSTTAWLTAVTGVGPDRHGVPGMVYRVPDQGALVYAVTGRVLARGPADPEAEPGLVLPHPTVFERAGEAGVECRALAREIGWLTGAWARALLRGANLLAGPAPEVLAAQAAEPARLTDAVRDEVDAALAAATVGRPQLLWVYVNLDDRVHRRGYDPAALAAIRGLGEHAARWSALGWTVVGHADHGQVPSHPDPALSRAWSRVDDPVDCFLPGGGAGRVRWLYARPDRVEVVRARLADALGDAATVLTADQLAPLGLAGAHGLLRDRIGSVVAVAASASFPVPDPALGWEHGGDETDEKLVPLAVWRS